MAMLKARTILEKLQGKYDPEIISILCSLAERDDVQHKQIMQLAEAYDRLVNMFSRVAQGAMKSKDVMDKLLTKMGVSGHESVNVKSIAEDDDREGGTRN